mmetsp:Transcript_4982/g.12899  ORF Transcript_4982/g.12899 Transcript_4982/m.12899 type:complete len:219 (-) Transcript_4982:36-692(-)
MGSSVGMLSCTCAMRFMWARLMAHSSCARKYFFSPFRVTSTIGSPSPPLTTSNGQYGSGVSPEKLFPSSSLASMTVFSGLSDICFRASLPKRREKGSKAVTEAVVSASVALGYTRAPPFHHPATQHFPVPRSMPRACTGGSSSSSSLSLGSSSSGGTSWRTSSSSDSGKWVVMPVGSSLPSLPAFPPRLSASASRWCSDVAAGSEPRLDFAVRVRCIL